MFANITDTNKHRTPGYRKVIGVILFVFIMGVFLVPSVSAQSGEAQVGVFEPQEAAPGSRFQVPVSVRSVTDLYGLDFILEFDPAVLQMVDVDPADEGVQAALGDFLDPGLLLFNDADNEAGTYRFAMSQVNPSEPKSGAGNVVIISFEVVGEGETSLDFSYLKMGTREGNEIPSTGVNGLVIIIDNASPQSVTYQVSDATSIIAVQTFTPTPTATPAPTKTPLPTGTANTEGDTLENTDITGGTNNEDSDTSFWLLKNWWLLVGLLVIVVILTIYLMKNKSVINKEEELNHEK